MWGHENPQDPDCARSRTVFVVTFDKFPLLWLSKLTTYIFLSVLHSEYVEFSHSIRALLPLKSLIKEVIDNLAIKSDNMKFVSRSNIYEENNGVVFVATSPRMTPTSKNIFSSIIGSGSTLERNFWFVRSSQKIRRQIFSPKVYRVNFLSGL